jgi:hypothetical protein
MPLEKQIAPAASAYLLVVDRCSGPVQDTHARRRLIIVVLATTVVLLVALLLLVVGIVVVVLLVPWLPLLVFIGIIVTLC